jgi:glutamate dehydrogenase
MANTLSNYPDIATDIVSLFGLMFSPSIKRMPKKIETLKTNILIKLDKVP